MTTVGTGGRRVYAFVGKSVFAPGQVSDLSDKPSEATLRQAIFQIRSLAAYFKEMRSATLFLDSAESAAMRRIRGAVSAASYLDTYASSATTMDAPFGNVHLQAEGIRIGDEVEIIGYPSGMSRARKVLVVDYWGPDEIAVQSPMRRSRNLELLLPLVYRSSAARMKAQSLLRDLLADEAPLLAVYTVGLDAAVTPDKSVAKLEAQLTFDRVHGLPTKFDPTMFKYEGQDETTEAQRACATCHEDAFRRWSESRHSHAYTTLIARGQSGDARCTSCHTNKSAPPQQGLAVTCESCHTVPGATVAAGACKQCHTTVTDPLNRFSGALNSICVEPADKSQVRLCMGKRQPDKKE